MSQEQENCDSFVRIKTLQNMNQKLDVTILECLDKVLVFGGDFVTKANQIEHPRADVTRKVERARTFTI